MGREANVKGKSVGEGKGHGRCANFLIRLTFLLLVDTFTLHQISQFCFFTRFTIHIFDNPVLSVYVACCYKLIRLKNLKSPLRSEHKEIGEV